MAKKATHITDKAARAMDHAADELVGESDEVPGPSPNPSTNLIIHDILMRSISRMSREAVEKAVLGRRYGSEFAKDVVENRSLLHTLAAYGVTRVATRSVPGAVIVGGGLLIKTLFDRSQSRRKAKRSGEKTLRKQADPDSAI